MALCVFTAQIQSYQMIFIYSSHCQFNSPTLQNKKQNPTIYEEFLFSRGSATGTPKKHKRKTKLKLLKEVQKIL